MPQPPTGKILQTQNLNKIHFQTSSKNDHSLTYTILQEKSDGTEAGIV